MDKSKIATGMTIARDAIIILILGAALDFLGSPLRSERDLSNLQTCDKSPNPREKRSFLL